MSYPAIDADRHDGRPREFTDAQRALLPSNVDITGYEERGYYRSQEGVIPGELIDLAIRGAERLYRGERDWDLPIKMGYSSTRICDESTPRNHEFVSLQIRELRELALDPMIGAIAARLARSASIRLLDDQLVWKPSIPAQAEVSITGWHADMAYWGTCSSGKPLTAWIPLHDVEITRGPLVVMEGSHRWKGLGDMRNFNCPDLQESERRFREEGKDVRVIPMTLKKGQISFHHGWTMHASFPNTSGLARLALAVHLQDGENHYRPYWDSRGREVHIFDEQLCRRLPNGDPDFSDPAIFPTIWSEQV